jgi:hypothetical protein
MLRLVANEMTTNQLFFAFMLALFGMLKYYLDAKIDQLQAQVKQHIDYMVRHGGQDRSSLS